MGCLEAGLDHSGVRAAIGPAISPDPTFLFTVRRLGQVAAAAAATVILLAAAGPQAADLPNPSLTPGAARSGMDVATVCSTRWGLDARHVTAKMKREVFAAYGYPKGNKDPRCPCEIDHSIPRELGGQDSVDNLWVQSFRGPWNAHDKDRLENKVHKMVCTGAMTLAHARKAMASDWIGLYEKLFDGEP